MSTKTMTQRCIRPDRPHTVGPNHQRATQKNERFVVDRRGEPSVVIMSIKDYVDTIAPTPDWLKQAHVHAKRNGLDKLSMRHINKIIASVRQERKQTKRGGK